MGKEPPEKSLRNSAPDESTTAVPLKPHFSVNDLKAAAKSPNDQVNVLKQEGALKAGKLDYKMPFSALFKYDTSPHNPEHKCYDFRKPLTGHQTFLFNFMSKKQYNIDRPE